MLSAKIAAPKTSISTKIRSFATCASGRKESTSIDGKIDPSTRSVGPLITVLLDKVTQVETLNNDQRILVESVMWPILARRSTRKELFSNNDSFKFQQSLQKTAHVIKKYTTSDNREQVFMKYWLDYYLCKVFKDAQTPLKAEWIQDNLFFGWIRRFISRSISKQDVGLIYSLQKGSKKLWPPLGQEKLVAAYQTHHDRLTTDHGKVPEDLRHNIMVTSLEIFSSINRFQQHQVPLPTKFVPSQAACTDVTREYGGTRALFTPFPFEKVLESDESKKVGTLRALSHSFVQWREEEYRRARSRISSLEDDKLYHLKVVAIPEASKFRIITKGNGYLYTALQLLQGQMIDCWKSSRFSTMHHDDLTERVRTLSLNCARLDYFCSVDYEAATDLIKKDATLAAFEPLRFVTDYDIAMKGFQRSGFLQYPKKMNIPMDRCVDGQLMGHPLSFPLLCVINLSVFRNALSKYVMDPSIGALRKAKRFYDAQLMWNNVLVNGDDMLFKCNEDFYPFFIESARGAGLKLSVGKNYLSPNTCMINSQVFKWNPDQAKLERIGYLNLKFINPVDLNKINPMRLSKDLNSMFRLCPWSTQLIPAVFKQWEQNTLINNNPKHKFVPNWYLPVHLGGCGIDPRYGPKNNQITRDQRKVARLAIKELGYQLFLNKHDYEVGGEVRLLQKKFPGLFLQYKYTDPFRPLNYNETTESDPWLERLSLIVDMANCGLAPESRSFRSKRNIDLIHVKPFSVDKIQRLQEIKVIAIKGPELPDLVPITQCRDIQRTRILRSLPGYSLDHLSQLYTESFSGFDRQYVRDVLESWD